MPITPEDFVRTWQQSSSAKEVAEKLKLTYGAATSRACLYRKSGVSLKLMPKGGGRKNLDWAKLDDLAKSLVNNEGGVNADH